MDVKNSVAIVTGASGGIGEATARLLASKGAYVVVAARSEEKLHQLSRELPQSLPITTDMTQQSDIQQMVQQTIKHFGKIDILINNAGQGYDSTVEDITIKTFEYIFKLDLVGPLFAMQQVIPFMKKQKKGTIINISSGTALMYLPNMSAYSSMKRALVGLSLTAREELKGNGITVSVVYPYITHTNFEENTIKKRNISKNDEDGRTETIPKGDSPDYVAQKILEAIQTGKPEIFAHEWMGKNGD